MGLASQIRPRPDPADRAPGPGSPVGAHELVMSSTQRISSTAGCGSAIASGSPSTPTARPICPVGTSALRPTPSSRHPGGHRRRQHPGGRGRRRRCRQRQPHGVLTGRHPPAPRLLPPYFTQAGIVVDRRTRNAPTVLAEIGRSLHDGLVRFQVSSTAAIVDKAERAIKPESIALGVFGPSAVWPPS